MRIVNAVLRSTLCSAQLPKLALNLLILRPTNETLQKLQPTDNKALPVAAHQSDLRKQSLPLLALDKGKCTIDVTIDNVIFFKVFQIF